MTGGLPMFARQSRAGSARTWAAGRGRRAAGVVNGNRECRRSSTSRTRGATGRIRGCSTHGTRSDNGPPRSMADHAAHDGPPATVLEVYLLGTVHFEEMLRVQRRLVYDVAGDRARGVLILCEHPAGISVGREGSRAHIRCGPAELAARQWPVRG